MCGTTTPKLKIAGLTPFINLQANLSNKMLFDCDRQIKIKNIHIKQTG